MVSAQQLEDAAIAAIFNIFNDLNLSLDQKNVLLEDVEIHLKDCLNAVALQIDHESVSDR